MRITEALLGEHAVFYAQFDHLEQTVPTAPTLGRIQGQATLLAAALASHAGLEEELLFSNLEPHLGPAGPLAVMRIEHDQIETLLNQVPEARDIGQAQRLLLQVVQVARNHFAKEEQILFPLAEQVLGGSKLAELATQWAGRRGLTTRTTQGVES